MKHESIVRAIVTKLMVFIAAVPRQESIEREQYRQNQG